MERCRSGSTLADVVSGAAAHKASTKDLRDELHAFYVTFSCYKRRHLLNADRAKAIVLGNLHAELKKRDGLCTDFVIMPDHVRAVVWFPKPKQLSGFMNKRKDEFCTISVCKLKGRNLRFLASARRTGRVASLFQF